MKQAERHLSDGVHPRLLCEGIELAKIAVLEFVDKVKMEKDCLNHDLLVQVRPAAGIPKMLAAQEINRRRDASEIPPHGR
jgi:T-complex protein 1 subunit zeta